jgi:antitoxin YefM
MVILPLTDAKAKLNELVDDAVTTHERVTITRRGKPAVVLISVEDLESLEETLYWQAQPGVHEDLAHSRAQASSDELWDEASVRRRYGVSRVGHRAHVYRPR